MTRRRTECIDLSISRTAGVFTPADAVVSHLVGFSEFARPMSPEYADGQAVLEPWVLSVSMCAQFVTGGGSRPGPTDYEGLYLEAAFVDYDTAQSAARFDPERAKDLGAISKRQQLANIATPSLARRVFYASNGTSDGYPVPRQVVPDASCAQTQRTYYWPLFLVASLDPSFTTGTTPPGGLPDDFTMDITALVDHEWRWRTI